MTKKQYICPETAVNAIVHPAALICFSMGVGSGNPGDAV